MWVPPTLTLPALGRSMPVTMFTNVDLPLPERPTTLTNSPGQKSRSMPLSASKSPAPVLYVLRTPRMRTLGSELPRGRAVSEVARALRRTMGMATIRSPRSPKVRPL